MWYIHLDIVHLDKVYLDIVYTCPLDFCATVPFIKSKLRIVVLTQQAKGDGYNWSQENSLDY